MPEFEKYHNRCGLPERVCVCDGAEDPIVAVGVACSLCTAEYIVLKAPGLPIVDVTCIRCRNKSCLMKTGEEVFI